MNRTRAKKLRRLARALTPEGGNVEPTYTALKRAYMHTGGAPAFIGHMTLSQPVPEGRRRPWVHRVVKSVTPMGHYRYEEENEVASKRFRLRNQI